jgi:MFS family permease
MLVGRSIQGTGAGGLLSLSEVVITDLVPLRYRGDYYGGMNAMWAVGSVLGPILGGGFSGNEHATWVCGSSTSHAAHFLMTMLFKAVDILYKLSVHWHWNHIRALVHALAFHSEVAPRPTSFFRLDRDDPLCC